ncbi:MAG: hypothetical protein A2218_12685 [Elusimicrobia bacterium RIFOXYA2_FULL_53_38]|nr:MAG: hypothetical protein A2218_12685 [Elusimicrobia bacterium RIFOXYA2_FULL_53_38]
MPPDGKPKNSMIKGFLPAGKKTSPLKNNQPYTPPAFDGARIKKHINALAGPGIKGRGPGETGLNQAAVYIANQFLGLDLRPFESKNLMHKFEGEIGGNTYQFINIIGKLHGSSPRFAGEYVVISAHYDHLPSKNGAIYPGANDNASGVAVLLELVGYFSKHRPKRSLLFAAFSGEEEGRLGSRDFVAKLPPAGLAAINAVINLDTIGSLNKTQLIVVNAESSDAWSGIIRAVSSNVGLEAEIAARDLDSSDQVSFIEKGIPGVQLFTMPGADYHKPSDIADKIDINGMLRVGEFAREMVNRLAGSAAFIPRQKASAVSEEKHGETGISAPRTARAGFTPDFTWQGKGVRIAEISADCPLARLGIKTGDVLVRLDGIEILNLRGYAQELKKRKPGDIVELTLISGGVEKTVKTILQEQEKK